MRKLVTIASLVVLVVRSVEARAEKPKRWDAGLRSGILWIGNERPTGGLTLGAYGRYQYPIGEVFGVTAGVGMDFIGVGDPLEWLTILGGPDVGVSMRAGKHWLVAASHVWPWGRATVCTDWGLCKPRYWGFFPGGTLQVTYGSDWGRFGVEMTGLYVDVLASENWDAWHKIAKGMRITGALQW